MTTATGNLKKAKSSSTLSILIRSLSVVLLLLLVITIVVSELITVPYYALSPGGTFSIANQIKSSRPLKIKGQIEGVYVNQTHLSLFEYAIDKFKNNVTIYKSVEIASSPTGKILNSQALTDENQWYQESSQDLAIAAALKTAGFKISELDDGALIGWVDPTAPAGKVLKEGEIIEALDGIPTPTVAAFLHLDSIYVKPFKPITLKIKNPSTSTESVVRLTPTGIKSGSTYLPYIGIGLLPRYKLPFSISISSFVNGQPIGGPSAGLAYALYISDALKGGNLTHNKLIAATGTIDQNGQVGPIGGLKEKVIAVKDSGATLFFVPASQSKQDLETAKKIAGKNLTIVPVDSLAQAIAYLISH